MTGGSITDPLADRRAGNMPASGLIRREVDRSVMQFSLENGASDALLRPRLAPEEFEKERALAVQSIAAAKDSDPSALLGAYGDAWLFRGHPYGRPVGGDESSLAAVTIEDLQRHYRTERAR